jgi:hypothetical protein
MPASFRAVVRRTTELIAFGRVTVRVEDSAAAVHGRASGRGIRTVGLRLPHAVVPDFYLEWVVDVAPIDRLLWDAERQGIAKKYKCPRASSIAPARACESSQKYSWVVSGGVTAFDPLLSLDRRRRTTAMQRLRSLGGERQGHGFCSNAAIEPPCPVEAPTTTTGRKQPSGLRLPAPLPVIYDRQQ